MLAMLAGLSIGTLQNVVTEYQLSTQDADKTLALESAQYALAEAKRLILTNWSPGAPTCQTVSPCNPNNSNGIAVWNYGAFKNASDFSRQPASYFNAAQPTAAKPLASLAAAPRFFVIDLGCDVYSKANIYRILAQGYGISMNSVAYAESQLTMPLSGQNSYVNAPVTPLVGVAVPSSTAAPSAAINLQNYHLALSTNSRNLFFNNGGGATCSNPGQRLSTGATCEMNCLGQVRVKGYSAYNGTGCPWIYSDWVPATNQSVLQLNSGTPSAATTVTLSCGPCQIAMTVPHNLCTSGQYNSCTGSCVPGCTGGQYLQGSTCVCPSNQAWNGTICTNCPAGESSSAGGACTPCPAGQFSSQGGSCTACPAGQSSSAGGSCTNCPAGQSSNAGRACANCPAGQFSSAGGSCTNCPAGQSSNAGRACANCPAGQFSSAGGGCTPCAAGTYSGAGASGCGKCPGGNYSNAGASSCTPCAAGQAAGIGASSCTPCPAGWFVPSANKANCLECSAGSYSPAGASGCSACNSGSYSSAGAGSCTPCAAGTRSNSTSFSTSCVPCPSGFYAPAGSSYCIQDSPVSSGGT